MKIKNKILFLTTIIFTTTIIGYNAYLIYMKNSFIKENINSYNQEFDTTFKAIEHNIYNTLSKRIKVMVTKKNHLILKNLLKKTISQKDAYKYIHEHFLKLKTELRYLSTMHLYDKNGISLLRAHNKEKYGDDLTTFRPNVKKLIQNPKSIAFFETGVTGLFFRVVEPIYEKDELLGFIELGLVPRVFIERIKQFKGLDSYIFIDKDVYKKIDKINIFEAQNIEFGNYKFFSRCDIDKTMILKLPKKYDLTNDLKFIADNKTIMTHKTNIKNLDGKNIALFLSFQDFSNIEKSYNHFFLISIILSILAVIIILLVLNKSYSKLTNELEKYLSTLDKINDSIFVIEASTHKIVFSNEQAQKTLGYTKTELQELTLGQISLSMNMGEEIICIKRIKNIKLSDESFITRGYNRSKDGSVSPTEISFSYVKDDDNEFLVAICHNIETQLTKELKDKANEKIINQYIPISQTDLKGSITYVNDAFCELTGYDKDELIGQNHRILKHPDTQTALYKELWKKISDNKSWHGIVRNITKNEQTIWANVKIEPIYDYFNKKIGYISTREDISDKKELEYMSDHDLLTKAKNRRSFERALHNQIKSAQRYQSNDFAIIMLDIDYFKLVNDNYGHHIGDKVLENLSEAIHLNIRESDIFARWGGEEFIILCPHTNKENIESFVLKIQMAIKNTNFDPVEKITASFGITLFKDDDTMLSIQKRADQALYKAKENGRDRYEIL